MLKRIFFGSVCLILFGLMITAWNLSVRADDTSSPFSPPNIVALSTVLPSAFATAITHDAVANHPELASPPPSVWPMQVSDSGLPILYQRSGQQKGESATKTVEGQFPAIPDFAVHIACQGDGFVAIQVGDGMFSEVSCPQTDNVNQYTISPMLTLYNTIRITVQGTVVWRVMVVASR